MANNEHKIARAVISELGRGSSCIECTCGHSIKTDTKYVGSAWNQHVTDATYEPNNEALREALASADSDVYQLGALHAAILASVDVTIDEDVTLDLYATSRTVYRLLVTKVDERDALQRRVNAL